jgi:cyclin-dependent kinase-like
VGLLRSLRHDNVVSLLDVFRHRGKLCLVFEFVEGTVLQLLEAAPGGLPEAQAKRVLWQVLRALEYLHSRGVVHRDVKPENLLVSGQGVVKLCDFGFARRLHDGAVAEGGAGGGGGGRYTDYVATRRYRAPELLQGARDYGTPVDVWAVGAPAAERHTCSRAVPRPALAGLPAFERPETMMRPTDCV